MNQEEPQMSGPQPESEITHDGQNSTNRTGTTEEANYCSQVLDALYERITSENDPAKLQKVLLSSSYPSPISLKLQGIQEMLKGNKGRMDIDSINFAIRKLRREEIIDRSPTDFESMIGKYYYFSTDFVRLASSEDDGLLGLETCVRNDFMYHHHNAFGQDPDLSVQEVIFIPVIHHGCWSLYAFNISDKKLSIFDPATERMATPESEHENSRLKICKALEFVKDNFNLFKNASSKFSSWRYEFSDLGQFRETSSLPATPLRICSDEDSGFFVFNLMRRWDGQRFTNPGEIPKEPERLRKDFLEYIVSFSCNEVYELDDLPDVFGLMEKLKCCAQKVSGRPAWTRCKMDTGLLKAVRENNIHEFAGLLFKVTERSLMLQQNLRREATCDGDGILHIAARYGNLELLRAIFKVLHVDLNIQAIIKTQVIIKTRMLEAGRTTKVEDVCVQVLPMEEEEEERQQRLVELQELLRSRNHKGETCLHDAVRHGDELFALSLILADEKIMKDVIRTNGRRGRPPIFADGIIRINDVIKTNGPPLVQIVDYEGVSPLYLATTLCCSGIVRTILTYQAYEGTSWQLANQAEVPAPDDQNGTSGQLANQAGIPAPDDQSIFCCWPGRQMPARQHIMAPAPAYQIVAPFSGPGGKTALHAAVVLTEEITKQVLDWMIHVKDVPDLTVMSDSSGNTPLHLVSSVDDGAAIAKLLLSVTAEVASGSGTVGKPTRAALKKDSKCWLPIHVAAANGNLGVIKQLIDKCPECIESRNASGQSFLHVAVEKKKRNVVQYVCSQQSFAGILNLTDQDGNTALHLAVEGGNQRIFCDLMGTRRVYLSCANRKGWTPLAVARLSMGPGLRLITSSRVLTYWHLRLSGAHYGTCRRDVLNDEIAGKLDKDKLSESISKYAGILAVCATFILNMSVTTFFNIAKQDLIPTGKDIIDATDAPVPPVVSTAEGRRVRAFKALIVFDAITFASSLLAAFCCTFAGFSIMDRRARFVYLSIAELCFPIACLGLVAIFVMAVYLAYTPVDPHIALVACVLPLAVITPQLIIRTNLVLLHAWTLFRRRFFCTWTPSLSHLYYHQ